MSLSFIALIAVFVVFLIFCGVCGYRRKLVGFISVVVSGWTLNFTWMTLAFNAKPLDANALSAQLALAVYGLCGFATGWMISRMVRKFRDTAVED